MAEQLSRYPEWYMAGDKVPIDAADFEQDTLKAGTEVTVYSREVNQDEILLHGHGPHQRDQAEAFVGLDLVASGNGTGNAGDDIQGQVILAITNSDGTRVKADKEFDSLAQLRDSLAESRTDRIVEELMVPYAKPGRNIEVRVRAASGSDGVEVDPSASSGNLYYTQIDA